jgi:hypothetical protein
LENMNDERWTPHAGSKDHRTDCSAIGAVRVGQCGLAFVSLGGGGAAFWLGLPVTGAILIPANGFLGAGRLHRPGPRYRGAFWVVCGKIIDKYADLIFLLGMMLGGLAHPVAVIVSMVGIPLATYINAAVESLTKGEVKFQEKLSLRFLRIIFLVAGGLFRQTHLAVWLVAATVVYAVASAWSTTSSSSAAGDKRD